MLPDPISLLAALDAAIRDLHAAFGAPGDYGYGTPEGDALYKVYRLQVEAAALVAMAEVH